MIIPAAERIAELLGRMLTSGDAAGALAGLGVTSHRLLGLVEEVLGDDEARFPDGRMLIWDIARHDGYRIPDYPMAGCGDVKEFLSDEGARNIPDWYRVHLGMDRATYDEIYRYELVMVRNRALWRKVFLVPSATAAGDDGLLPRELLGWLSFALGRATDDDDPALFRR